MSKIKFGDAEKSMTSDLYKIKVDQLGKIADISQKFGQPELYSMAEKAIEAATKRNLENKAMLHFLKRPINQYKADDFYTEFELTYSAFSEMIQKQPKDLKEEDWRKLNAIKAKIKAEKEKVQSESNDEQFVNDKWVEQHKARINVPKKWLPLQ
jgi:hypothetical protein